MPFKSKDVKTTTATMSAILKPKDMSTTTVTVVSDGEGIPEKVPLRERLHHFTFAWYTMTLVVPI